MNPRYRFANEFHNLFGVFLADFWDRLTGFDVLRFDAEIVKPGVDESTRDAVIRQWGERAAFIVHELTGFSPLLARLG